jgi:hypothetical protein
MNYQKNNMVLQNTLVLVPISSDRQVNYGCNLKWKPAETEKATVEVVSNFIKRIVSRSLDNFIF